MIKNEELRTPWRVRLVVGLLGVALLVSTIAIYLTVFVQYGTPPKKDVDQASASELQQMYEELSPAVAEIAERFSAEHLGNMMALRSEVKAYNEEALELGVREIRVGEGREIESPSDPYLAYYIGWKPDEEILDSSFDNFESPTALVSPLPGSLEMIRGWLEGVVGMRIGGVREISITSDYAYGEGALKFIVMLIPYEDEQLETIKEFNEIRSALMYAQYNQ